MEHLKTLFHEELAAPENENARVENGRIYIRERHWAPDELLQTLGDPVYSEVFDAWLADRQDQMSEKAEDILDQFDQYDRFEMLKTAYRNEAVIPFVGAGMSIASGYPGWTQFLRRMRPSTSMTEAHFEALLTDGHYEQAAQELADELGAGFNERVEAKFGLERSLLGPVQLLPYVFNTSVVTTNFDDVVKRAYRNHGIIFDDEIPGTRACELPRYLASGQKILLKVHGTARSASSRVLTAKEYDAAYTGANPLPRAIRAICTKTLLFMGCSLSVDRLLNALSEYVTSEGHDHVARHYAFVAAPPRADDRRTKERALEKLNIYPIWYAEGNDDDAIEALLRRLADGVTEL